MGLGWGRGPYGSSSSSEYRINTSCWPSVSVLAHLRITLLEQVVLALFGIGAQRRARLRV